MGVGFGSGSGSALTGEGGATDDTTQSPTAERSVACAMAAWYTASLFLPATFLLLALSVYSRQGRLVGGLRVLVLVTDDEGGRRRPTADFVDAAPPRLLVLEGEPTSQVGRVEGVRDGSRARRRRTSSACALSDRGAVGTGILSGSICESCGRVTSGTGEARGAASATPPSALAR